MVCDNAMPPFFERDCKSSYAVLKDAVGSRMYGTALLRKKIEDLAQKCRKYNVASLQALAKECDTLKSKVK